MKRRIYINQDNGSFYGCYPSEEMSVAGLNRLVDFYATNTQVAGIMFCVNVQRALYDSQVWQPLYDGYDPAGGADQQYLAWLKEMGRGVEYRELVKGNHGRYWAHNLWLLNHKRRIDPFACWLKRCRHHNIEGWLSMRMNDCHYNQESEDAFWHSKLWQDRPDLRRASHRAERSLEGAFDYAKPEVREHHMALIRELFDRFDMFGLELDWMRWGMHFAPGHEARGEVILTEFMREVDSARKRCVDRVGHPVKLAVRVPAHPQTCLALGMDVITWANQKLADTVILSEDCNVHSDTPIGQWRTMLGEDVTVLVHVGNNGRSYPQAGRRVVSPELIHGDAATAIHKGADGVYLFNFMCDDSTDRQAYLQTITHIGDMETIKQMDRRHIVSYSHYHAPGETTRTVLPVPLRIPTKGVDFGRMEENITLRISIGPAPQSGQAYLLLGMSADAPDDLGDTMAVLINGRDIDKGLRQIISREQTSHVRTRHEFPETVEVVWTWRISLITLQDGVNVVEILPPSTEGCLEWGEIRILPGG